MVAASAEIDDRKRSEWSRVLRYVAEYKDLDEPPRDFIVRKGGITNAGLVMLVSLSDTDNCCDPLRSRLRS